MEKQQFINALKEALDIQERDVIVTDEFRLYPEWDSLAQLTLIAMLDDEYGVSFEMKLFNNLLTVGDLFNAINATTEGK